MDQANNFGELFEVLHEATKLVRGHDSEFRSQVGFYNSSEEGRNYLANAYKKFVGLPEIELAEGRQPGTSIVDCFANRTSVRDFLPKPITDQDLSSLLFLTYGNNLGKRDSRFTLPKRPYPAAGGLYAVEAYPILLHKGEAGARVCHYSRFEQKLRKLKESRVDDLRRIFNLPDAVSQAAGLIMVHTSIPTRVSTKYGLRGRHFAAVEMGLATQSLLIAGAALGLSSVVWGGYYDHEVEALLGIDGIEEIIATVTILGKAEK
ncbi:SagB/ThcOx family dehydrogenase [Rhizobium sp. VS19-DR104.2]|uniref:SagB/ThcOx family dehydrogenase n=1 Tax=unclassified Rhizobium TaxID=2613769 RepID=UPI001C5A8B29|nr:MULTISPECIES: SagB/ThcOx family dehydrogenase [unclassified Rhizobium]MBZ5763710.1 SagB/ThcOx family dehydrogenase [Rhizobium sp. VS19-DR96]MBZ5769645.1 SagB/ThcOx family dehydrogenase [Rhizobium sp. VS19-DR129.2]MBZ5777180.1 SagB/ThcOx family dehydrogenase [Rhizobium sp. VS19-DRK62.2]MBZ5788326.1 SagB/ThcOx family dehydrogenase [Rhizobium sp. VS19-DR121]MBZ5805779.1 SagB/ThcOx family dehydrogenase [Rhizobium sp. VS19-DR181]